MRSNGDDRGAALNAPHQGTGQVAKRGATLDRVLRRRTVLEENTAMMAHE